MYDDNGLSPKSQIQISLLHTQTQSHPTILIKKVKKKKEETSSSRSLSTLSKRNLRKPTFSNFWQYMCIYIQTLFSVSWSGSSSDCESKASFFLYHLISGSLIESPAHTHPIVAPNPQSWEAMRKRERENPCGVCGHYHKYEEGEICGICGHRAPDSSDKTSLQVSAFPSEILPEFLYLGSYDNASRSELLKTQGISRILNVRLSLSLVKLLTLFCFMIADVWFVPGLLDYVVIYDPAVCYWI